MLIGVSGFCLSILEALRMPWAPTAIIVVFHITIGLLNWKIIHIFVFRLESSFFQICDLGIGYKGKIFKQRMKQLNLWMWVFLYTLNGATILIMFLVIMKSNSVFA